MSEAQKTASTTREAIQYVGLAIAIWVFSIAAVNWLGPLNRAEQWLHDFRVAYLTPLAEQSDDVVVLAIDEETLQLMPYRSPLDRAFLASVIESLNDRHRVRAIGIDVIFDQPTVPEADDRLRSAVLGSGVPIVIATGEAQAGMTPQQLEFQESYLNGMDTGSAVLTVAGGTVRTYYPYSPTSGRSSFVNSIAAATGIEAPGEPQPILFRRAAVDNTNPVRIFPAQSVDILPDNWLENRIVLVGAVLPDRDQHRTPMSIMGGPHEFIAGVLIHAQVLAQLNNGESMPEVGGAVFAAIVLAATSIGLILALAPIPSALRISVALLVAAGYWFAAFSANVFWSAPLPLLEPSLGFVLAATLATARARKRERQRRIFLHSAFNQYVSAQIIDDIIANPDHLQLGGELRDMSFMFTDIAGFSTMAERIKPEALVEILSGYLDGIVEIALNNRGTIARFMGDGLLVFFGAPVADSHHRELAVKCALEIDEFCEAYRRNRNSDGHPLGETRIGLHSGKAVVGNVGGKRRFEYTAHGDVVNTAARLESANRHLGTRICISRETLDGSEDANFRPIGNVIVKGRSESMEVLTTWSDMAEEHRSGYLEAFALLQDEDPAVQQRFEVLSASLPEDRLIAMHLARLQANERGVTITLQEK